jgi:hypothetical protein
MFTFINETCDFVANDNLAISFLNNGETLALTSCKGGAARIYISISEKGEIKVEAGVIEEMEILDKNEVSFRIRNEW